MSIHYSQVSAAMFKRGPTADVFANAKAYAEYVESARREGVYGYRIVCHARDGARVLAETEFGEKRWVIDGTSNDYLHLSRHPQVIEAVTRAIQTYGVASQGSQMLNGNTPLHLDLEQRLAAFLGKEAVLLAPSGFAAMQATMQALLTPADVVFSDRFNHTSLDTGMQLSGAKIYRYPHGNLTALRQLLSTYRHQFPGAFMVTDGVFSVDGDVAPVPELIALAQEFGCRLIVDDAHGVGAINHGRGCAALPGVDILAGTLSKAFVATGGFVAGPREVIDYVRFFGAAACSTSNVSVANTAAALEALKITVAEPRRSEQLEENARWLRSQLLEQGVQVHDTPTPIINVVCGTDADAVAGWARVFGEGLLVHALPFPIVPHGKSCLRLRLTLAMGQPELAAIAQILSKHFRGRARPAFIAKARASKSKSGLAAAGLISRRVPTSLGDLVAHYRPGNGNGTHVFLHPLLFHAEVFSAIIQRLPRDASVVAVDLFGHGLSEQPISPSITLEDLSNAVYQALQALRVQGPLTLVGSSIGGMLALRLALAHPDRVSRLLLIGASADAEEGPAKRMFTAMTETAQCLGGTHVIEDVRNAMFSSSYLEAHRAEVDVMLHDLAQREIMHMLPCIHAVLERSSITQQLANVTAATVVMVGDNDFAEPVAHAVTLARLISESELVVVERAGHVVPLESPDAVTSILERWLDQTSSERAIGSAEAAARSTQERARAAVT